MWTNPQFSVDLFTFNKKILSGKLHYMCSDLLNKFSCKRYVMDDSRSNANIAPVDVFWRVVDNLVWVV